MSQRCREVVTASCLAVAVALLFSYAYGRTDRTAWVTPIGYSDDSLFRLAMLKAAADGHIRPFSPIEVPELGAPFAAAWDDYPRQHKLQYWLSGFVARYLGLFLTSNLLLLSAHVLAGLCLFTVARYLRIRLEWATLAALTFSLSPFLFAHGPGHLTVTMCWMLPLEVVVTGWCFSAPGVKVPSRRFAAGIAVAALQGIHKVYFSALLCQFLAIAALVQMIRRKPRLALGPVLLVVTVIGVTAGDNANTLLARWRLGPNVEAGRRGVQEVERYALKPVELTLAPAGQGHLAWGDGLWRYWRRRLYVGEKGAYLGLFAVAGLVALVLVGLRAFSLRRAPPWTSTLGAILWINVFSVVGGLNLYLGIVGFSQLRATSRYAVWIQVLVLLWFAGRLSRWTRRWPRMAALAAAAVASVVVAADQLPRPPGVDAVEHRRELVESDRAFVRSVEAFLGQDAMLFMLPVADMPEAGGIHQMGDYEHFRPYLFSSGLRFSYGSDKGRPRAAWQRTIPDLRPEQMVSLLERRGFAGLIINRSGYEQDAHPLLEGLAAVGRPAAFEEGLFVFVPLHPTSAAPRS